MLNTKALNQLLAQNTSPQLTNVFLSTPSGSLVAYSAPHATPELERQAILASNIWATYSSLGRAASKTSSSARSARLPPHAYHKTSDPRPHTLSPITVQLSGCILSVQLLSPSNILMCAFGPPPPPPAESPPAEDTANSPPADSDNTSTSPAKASSIEAPTSSDPSAPVKSSTSSIRSNSPPEPAQDRINGDTIDGGVGDDLQAEQSSSSSQAPAAMTANSDRIAGEANELTAQAEALANRVKDELGTWEMPVVEIT
ncbi:MAG: hypothetical protein M1837_005761 [Sclerophora amabilis]|nr:MAG: hypothetical protein M1837_005761 [Sclerophora amabilis]